MSTFLICVPQGVWFASVCRMKAIPLSPMAAGVAGHIRSAEDIVKLLGSN